MGLEDLSTPHPCLRLDSFQHASQWPVPFCSKIGSPRRGRQPLGAWNDSTERGTCRSKAGSDLTRVRSPSNQGHGLADLSAPAKWACTTFHQPQNATSDRELTEGNLNHCRRHQPFREWGEVPFAWGSRSGTSWASSYRLSLLGSWDPSLAHLSRGRLTCRMSPLRQSMETRS